MRRTLKAFGTLLAVVALAVGAALVVAALNLRTYGRLTYEQPVAELSFEARGPQRFLAILTRLPEREVQLFEIAGDEWQVDARVLKWHGWANLLGFDARYRLERVSGRYRDIEQERTEPRSVFALSETPAIDLWALAEAHPMWFPFVDGLYGSGTFMPMAGGAEFEVTLTQSGLIARAKNPAARAASRGLQ